MKRHLSFFCTWILVLSFVLTGCIGANGTDTGASEIPDDLDPIAGVYQPIREDQVEKYANYLEFLSDVVDKQSTVTVATVTITDEETGDATVVTDTTLADFSESGNLKMHETLTVKKTTRDGVRELTVSAYSEQKKTASLVEINGSLPGEEAYSFKGTVARSVLGYIPNPAGGFDAESVIDNLIGALEDLGTDAAVEVYVDGSMIRASIQRGETEWISAASEFTALLDRNGFRCQTHGTLRYADVGTEILEGEAHFSDVKVTVPTSGYEQEMSDDEFMELLDTYLRFADTESD